MAQQLWSVLERYQDVFAWNKGELGCYTMGEHVIDTQGYPPCRVTPGRLSYWEEAEVNRQINVLVELGKMRLSIRLSSYFTYKKGWKQKILWRLPTSESTNQKGCIPYAVGSGCDLPIGKICMVQCTRSTVEILADQDGTRRRGQDSPDYQERSVRVECHAIRPKECNEHLYADHGRDFQGFRRFVFEGFRG